MIHVLRHRWSMGQPPQRLLQTWRGSARMSLHTRPNNEIQDCGRKTRLTAAAPVRTFASPPRMAFHHIEVKEIVMFIDLGKVTVETKQVFVQTLPPDSAGIPGFNPSAL